MRTSINARANLNLIEENYRRWQENPDSVDAGWSAFFEGFELGNLPQQNGAATAETEAREAALQTRVDSLVYAYCSLGHMIARVDPLAETVPATPLLSLKEFGCSNSDLALRVSSRYFSIPGMSGKSASRCRERKRWWSLWKQSYTNVRTAV